MDNQIDQQAMMDAVCDGCSENIQPKAVAALLMQHLDLGASTPIVRGLIESAVGIGLTLAMEELRKLLAQAPWNRLELPPDPGSECTVDTLNP